MVSDDIMQFSTLITGCGGQLMELIKSIVKLTLTKAGLGEDSSCNRLVSGIVENHDVIARVLNIAIM